MAVIHLTDEQKKSMMEDIAYFFDSEYDEQIGIIKQMRLLEFFTEELAPVIYNKALELIRDGIYLEEPEEVIKVADEPNRNLSYIVIGIFLVSIALYFGLKKRK